MKVTLQKRLERCPLFAGISELLFLTRCFQPLLQRLEAGEGLDWQGGGYAAVVAEGCVHTEGEVFSSGSVLGLESALWDTPRPAVVAERASLLLLLPTKRLFHPCESHCKEHRQLAENAAHVLAQRSLDLRERQAYLLIRGTRPRLCTYLLRRRAQAGRDTFALPMNRQAMADYLNLSRPSLSRELCQLRDEGSLEFYRETVRLLKPDALEN